MSKKNGDDKSRELHLELDNFGHGKVSLEGHDISNLVRGVSVHTYVDQPTDAIVYLSGVMLTLDMPAETRKVIEDLEEGGKAHG